MIYQVLVLPGGGKMFVQGPSIPSIGKNAPDKQPENLANFAKHQLE